MSKTPVRPVRPGVRPSETRSRSNSSETSETSETFPLRGESHSLVTLECSESTEPDSRFLVSLNPLHFHRAEISRRTA